MKIFINFIVYVFILSVIEIALGYLFTMPNNTLLPSFIGNYFCLSVGVFIGVVFYDFYKPININKKIRFRIAHYYQKCYVIEYSTYYFVPIFWKVLLSPKTKYYRDVPELFSKDQAEYFCKIYKQAEDIKLFNHELFLDKYCEFKLQNP